MNVPLIDAAAQRAAEDRLAALLGVRRDLVLLPGEAILALEAVARSVGVPGRRALNVVTGPYGSMMGRWMAASGSDVVDLVAPDGRAIAPSAVRAALAERDVAVVSVVHAEAATGVVNPLPEIAHAVRSAGALLVVDAVASVGAEPLPIEDLDLDLVIVGPQKALAGPAGVCGVIAGERAWTHIAANPAAPRGSILSLLDVGDAWPRGGRATLPFVPHHAEMQALDTALRRLETEGVPAVIVRHRRARDAARAGLRALGLPLWVAADEEAASVATLFEAPPGLLGRAAIPSQMAPTIRPAPGPLADRLLRFEHTGAAASLDRVLGTLAALAMAVEGPEDPLAPAVAAWRA